MSDHPTFTRYVTSLEGFPRVYLVLHKDPPFCFWHTHSASTTFFCLKASHESKAVSSASSPFTTPRSGLPFWWPKKNWITHQKVQEVRKGKKCRKEGFLFWKKSSQFTDTGWKWVNCNWEFISEVLTTYCVKTKLSHTALLGNTYLLFKIEHLFMKVYLACPLP